MPKQDQQIKDLKEISIVIDDWDDIFSDFDPRPLSEKVLSEDFIFELKKRYFETRSGKFMLTILAPKSLENEGQQKAVVSRLKKHFKHLSLQALKEINSIKRRGAIFVAFGILSLGLLTFITYSRFFSDLAIELIGIVLMPLGWFGIWEGFSKIVESSPILSHDEALFRKLSKANYQFRFIEDTGTAPA